jgi:Terminase large subunit, T4likevirus-type, N-terminal
VSSYLDLLPYCYRLPCPAAPDATGRHKHLLPAQRELLTATERYVASIGGYGSGKTSAAALLVHLLMVTIPGNRAFIGRLTYPNLHESAHRIYMEILERSGVEWDGRERMSHRYHWIVYPNGSEVFLRQTADPGRSLGPEYGVIWLDEAIEMPRTLFTAFTGRLRLGLAGRHRRFIVTSNPGPPNHWLTEIFGAAPGIREMHDPETGVSFQARRIGSASDDNPALPEDYVAALRATHSSSEIERILKGKTTFISEGRSVFCPPFGHSKHVGEPKPITNSDGLLPGMTRGWDFGFHHPVVQWSQLQRCREGQLHWFMLDEYCPSHVDAEDLARTVVSRSKERFAQVASWVDIGDAAGAQLNGPIGRLHLKHGFRFRYRKLPSLDTGIALIRQILAKPVCRCGRQMFEIHRKCGMTIEMLYGGYHYAKEQHNREPKEKPVKDGLYDNPADAMRYVAEVGYRPLMLDPGALDRLVRYEEPRTKWRLPGRDDDLTSFEPYWPRSKPNVHALTRRMTFGGEPGDDSAGARRVR